MSTYILTSWFPNGFSNEIAELMKKVIKRRKKFAFIASEFEKFHEMTDQYFREILQLFQEIGIDFETSYVIDGRMKKEEAKDAVQLADVVWLSGGDTIKQYQYLVKYELINQTAKVIRRIVSMETSNFSMVIWCCQK